MLQHRHTLPLALSFLALASCASTPSSSSMPAAEPQVAEPQVEEEAEAKEPDQAKIDELQHKLEVARIKLDLALLSANRADLEQARGIAHASQEVQMARANMEHFTNVEKPADIGRAKLSLQGARDSATEADEELQQIELMYKDQNLEDMTAEFVIQRGRRRAQRAQKRLEFQELDLKALETHQLPQKHQKLSQTLLKAEESLDNANSDSAKTELNRKLSLSQAKNALHLASVALEDAQAEGEDS
ncbi:MAG: archaellum component FlaC [Candidatus Paceibacteria bacterium]|jgi:archaellum component FlaC